MSRTLPVVVMTALVGLEAAPAGADPSTGRPGHHVSACGPEAGLLTTSNFPEHSNVVECRAVGRRFSYGRLVGQVPAPGETLIMEAIHTDGAETIEVAVSEAGTISYDNPDALLPASVASGGPAACDDTAYTDKDAEQAGTYKWWLGDGTRPAGLTTSQTSEMLKQAVGWIETSYNDCGLADLVSADAAYQGVSTKESDFTSTGGQSVCGDGSLDGRDGASVVDFGNLDGNGAPPLANTCIWTVPMPFADNNILEADIRFNTTDFAWFNTQPVGCSNKYDLRSVAVHEFGHAFGMGHVAEATHGNLTMSTKLQPCTTSQRSLGRGDVLSLRNTY